MLYDLLKKIYGFDQFRPQQLPIIESISNKKDTYAIMTTGGGKSLCFQLTGLSNYYSGEGATVIISPLISLMEDQVTALRQKGIRAGKINSSISSIELNESLTSLVNGAMPLVYLSPEQLGNEEVLECLKRTHISMVVYDEAHAVSIWGANFRPSYLKVNDHIKEIELYQNKRIQRSAFTATSRDDVTQDVARFLGMDSPTIIKGNPDRPNIRLHTENSKNKIQDTLAILREDLEKPTIIYCVTVKGVKELTRRLEEKGIPSIPYYGGLDDDEKKRAQEEFINNRCKTLVATKAFGMGIDKADVRRVIHFNMPASIEDYYQEAGRAGRDGKQSDAYLLYSPSDRNIHDFFLYCQFPPEEVVDEVKKTALALTKSGPDSFSTTVIAGACHGEVDPKHVLSSLRILKEFNVLDVEEQLGTNMVMIDTRNPDASVDYEILRQRRSANTDKLSTMKRYSITSSCKRSFIMEYFGEPTGHQFCGACSTCISKSHDNLRLSDNYDKATREAVFSAVQASKGKLETAISILRGLSTPRMEKRGYTKCSAHGSMAGKTNDEIRATIKKMEASGALENVGGTLAVNNDLLEEVKNISPFISSLRKELSKSMKLPEFMVLSEVQCKELSSIPQDEDLSKAMRKIGIDEKIVNKYQEIQDKKSMSPSL